jgi:choice-of-anchor A domain-containing protein
MNRILFASTIIAAAIAVHGNASTLITVPTISPYNALVFGNLSDTADFGGGVAAAGTINISNTAVADSLQGETVSQFVNGYTLVSGGNLYATNGSLAIGSAYGGGKSNNFTLTMQSGYQYTKSPAADPLNFAALQSQDDILSRELATLSTTGTCTFDGYSTTTCTANNAGLNVITLANASLVGLNHTVNITLASGAWLVINVPGQSDSMSNYGIYINGSSTNGDNTTAAAHNVLFNYYQATTLATYSVPASVFAPFAAVTGNSGQIDGNLVAASYTGSTELYNFLYQGTLPVFTPEPATVFLLGVGLLSFGLIGRRRRTE